MKKTYNFGHCEERIRSQRMSDVAISSVTKDLKTCSGYKMRSPRPHFIRARDDNETVFLKSQIGN